MNIIVAVRGRCVTTILSKVVCTLSEIVKIKYPEKVIFTPLVVVVLNTVHIVEFFFEFYRTFFLPRLFQIFSSLPNFLPNLGKIRKLEEKGRNKMKSLAAVSSDAIIHGQRKSRHRASLNLIFVGSFFGKCRRKRKREERREERVRSKARPFPSCRRSRNLIPK